MYLKSLEMQGFKSFPDKTKLVFEQPVEIDVVNDGRAHGITFIVGPNGSGKSNIVDAMRWVLGEVSAKTLRGSKMEDVIFSGADSRKPMGYAEVSITFDNRGEFGKLDSEYDEITVTRRFYRSTDSEYFINRKGVRLRDIYEMFLNTGIGRDGYSIIGQGRIAEMVSRKSEERRSAFEDASGIAKYRHKKEEEERKMAEVENNILRINDVYGEIEAQVGPLAKQAEKAKEAVEVMEQKKIADVTLWLYETENIQTALQEAQKNYEHAVFEHQQAEEELTSIQNTIEKLSQSKTNVSRDAEEARKAITEKTKNRFDAQSAISVAQNSLFHINEFLEGYRNDYTRKNNEYTELQNEVNLRTSNIDAINQEKEELIAKEKELNDERTDLSNDIDKYDETMSDAFDEQEKIDKEKEDLHIRISVLKDKNERSTDKNSGLTAEINKHKALRESLLAEKDRTEKICADHKKELQELAPAIDELGKKLENLRALKKEKETNLSNAIFQRDSVKSRIETAKQMEESMEGYPYAIKTLMSLVKENRVSEVSGTPCGKVYGPLVNLIHFDDKYAEAMNMALGANAQYVVVDNAQTAKSCIYAIKNEQAGVTTLFPIETMKAPTPTKEMESASHYAGYIGVASQLVSTDEKFANIVGALIGRTLVFDNLDNATKMAKDLEHRVRVVTLDGQMINAGGSFTGGGKGKDNKSAVARVAEKQKLEEQYKTLCNTAETCQKAFDTIAEDVSKTEGELNMKTAQRNLLSATAINEGEDATEAKYAYESNEQMITRLEGELNKEGSDKEEDENSLKSLEGDEANLQKRYDALEAIRVEYRGKKQKALQRTLEIDGDLRQIDIDKNAKDSSISAENTLKVNAETRCATAKTEADTAKEKLEAQENAISAHNKTIEENTALVEQLDKELEELETTLKNNETQDTEFEQKLANLRIRQNDAFDNRDRCNGNVITCGTKVESIRNKGDAIANDIWDAYGLSRGDALALNYPPVTKETYSEVQDTQKRLATRLRFIGNFDVDSIDRYVEIKKKYDYYTEQLQDLSKSKEELTKIVADLEENMKTTFVDAFNKINENFGKVFGELFGGGIAELSLSDPEDVLNSGIEIKAAPPGKIIKHLMALSGGEQSLVGVALFFAILQVNPTPFCILDEIDAALDSVNIDHLAAYLKKYSENTQFIIITHRQEMMSVADNLYGVSMPEHGISQIYKPDIDSIRKMHGKDWDTLLG